MEIVFDNDKFITTIQNLPSLWDKGHTDYANKVKKESDWRMALAAMYGAEEIDSWEKEKQNEIGKDLQRKWKNLRNSFARELAKRKNSKSGSGSTWKTYMYFEQMSFLKPSMSHAESETNFIRVEEEEIEAEEAPPLDKTSNEELSRRMMRKRKSSRSESEADLAAVLVKSLKWRQEKEEALSNDPDRLFLLSLLEDFKKLPNSRKAEVKIGMINAILSGLYPPQHHPFPPPTTPSSLSSSHITYNTGYPIHAVSFPLHQYNRNNLSRVTSSPSISTQNSNSPLSDLDSQSSAASDSSLLNLY